MQSIAISKFKATCLAVLEQVRKTGQPVMVTKRGTPIAQIDPPSPTKTATSAYGCMSGTAEESGDILEPLPATDWDSII